MKTYDRIQDLFNDLNLTTPSRTPAFNIYKYSELSIVKEIVFEPHRKRFFSINFHIKNVTARRIGYTYFDKLDRSINFNSPMQIFSIQDDKCIGREGFGVFFTENFFHPIMHRFDIIQKFPFFKLNVVPYYKLNDRDFNYIHQLLESIYKEYTDHQPCSLEIVQSQLLILLYYLKRITKTDNETIKLNRPEELTYKFEELILRQIDSHKTVAEYADRLNITPAYLSECVKKATGQTAKKIVIDYKLLRAKALLKNTSMPIAEVAHKMNYSETTNFIKFFKQHQGKTPIAYRNS
ncbi:MAG: AraC family transcriptional regulator [Bacteroidota bacterium]